jgi:hypothetical protein
MYRKLAVDLLASERPRNLSEEEQEQYALLLEEQAYPFEEEAIELHEANAARAAAGLYDDGVRASYAALAELKPARYRKSERLHDGAVHPEITAGLAALAAGHWIEAEAAFMQAGPGPAAWTAIGVARRNQGRMAEAQEAYEGGYAPRDPPPALNPAYFWTCIPVGRRSSRRIRAVPAVRRLTAVARLTWSGAPATRTECGGVQAHRVTGPGSRRSGRPGPGAAGSPGGRQGGEIGGAGKAGAGGP